VLAVPTQPTAEERRRAFGDALREAMSVQKMRQDDLASILGVRQPTVSGWINAISPPDSSEIVFAIEKALKLRPGALSRHLGFLPVEAVKTSTSVRAAVMDDPALSADEKSMLLAAYEAAAGGSKRRKPSAS
jgi:transcriptional regulator with XRE-family HTH domain